VGRQVRGRAAAAGGFLSIHRFSWKIDPNPEKKLTVGIVRYGAFGDLVQAVSICRAFKKHGYHVTLFCSYPPSEIAALEPSIDKMIVQRINQIPMPWLGAFWVWMSKKWMGKGFDRWVNLTESVESTLLAMEGNIKFEWPPVVRHQYMNQNYLEFQHKIAGVPYSKDPAEHFRFFPTDEEKKWLKEERERMRKRGIQKFVLWNLAGSSRSHKLYPHQQAIWEHVLKHYPDWGVVTVGDGSCADLESLKTEPRMWHTSGKWTIRQVLAAMELSDVVFGPETGVMSAAAFYPMPKILLLTHSTVENLSRDWVNTTSIWAPSTVCPGRGMNLAPACHMMHSKFEPGCRQNPEFGTAQCVVEIDPAWVWHHLQAAMRTGSGGQWTPPISMSNSGEQ
jgi:ADP-heptose:LPS heptosyltransferase